jgi:outer membrane protein
MKRYFCICLIFSLSSFLSAQRFAYVDMDLILEKMPNFQNYKKHIEEKISFFTEKIQKEKESLENLQEEFEEEKAFLLKNQLKEKKEEIKNLKEKIKKLETQYFHPQKGEIFKLQKGFLKPLKTQIHLIIKEISKKRNFIFVFDKKKFLLINDQDSKFDLTSQVLGRLLNIK